jgi:archaellum component FlaC
LQQYWVPIPAAAKSLNFMKQKQQKQKEEGLPEDSLKRMQDDLKKGSQMMTNGINSVMRAIEEKMAMISDDLPVKAELSKFLGRNK